LGLTLHFPVRLLSSLLSFLGGPVAWTTGALLGLSEAHRFQTGMWAGGIGTLGLLAICVRSLRSGRAPDALTLLGIGLMTYSFAAGSLVAVGRAIFEIDSVQVRYTPFAIPFWMGVAAVGASAVHAAGISRARVLFASILFTASIAMLPALETKLQGHRRQRGINTIALLQIMVGIRNDGFLSKVTRNADNARVLLPILERDRRGPFADPRYSLLGRPISEVYAGIGAVPCWGSIRSSQPIDAGGAQGAVISGIADQSGGAPALSFILVTDAQSTIRGLGNLRPGAGPKKVRWVAYLGPHAPEHAFEVYAELEDGSICRFDRAPRRFREESK